jgi:hypothetical protein
MPSSDTPHLHQTVTNPPQSGWNGLTDGTPNGKPPSMRHDRDCTHYNFRGGKRWGNPVEATEEQMRTLKACTTCVRKRAKSR